MTNLYKWWNGLSIMVLSAVAHRTYQMIGEPKDFGSTIAYITFVGVIVLLLRAETGKDLSNKHERLPRLVKPTLRAFFWISFVVCFACVLFLLCGVPEAVIYYCFGQVGIVLTLSAAFLLQWWDDRLAVAYRAECKRANLEKLRAKRREKREAMNALMEEPVCFSVKCDLEKKPHYSLEGEGNLSFRYFFQEGRLTFSEGEIVLNLFKNNEAFAQSDAYTIINGRFGIRKSELALLPSPDDLLFTEYERLSQELEKLEASKVSTKGAWVHDMSTLLTENHEAELSALGKMIEEGDIDEVKRRAEKWNELMKIDIDQKVEEIFARDYPDWNQEVQELEEQVEKAKQAILNWEFKLTLVKKVSPQQAFEAWLAASPQYQD